MRRAALLLLPALLLTACSSGSEKPDGAGIEGLVVQADDPSHDHVTTRQTYPQTPPVGGAHWPPSAFGATGWLTCGVYDAPVPDEFAVHSEEHGAVWLTYRPGASAADVAALTALRDLEPDYVLVSPYPAQASPVVASTWGAQLSVDSATDPRLERFVTTYAGGGQGSEEGAPCKDGSTPAQAEAALAAANPGVPAPSAPVPAPSGALTPAPLSTASTPAGVTAAAR